MAIAFLLFPVASGCDSSKTAPTTAFDFGPILVDESPELSHRFEIRNTTRKPLRILGETHSCSCTKVDLIPTTLAPGQSTSLTLHVKTKPTFTREVVACQVVTDPPNVLSTGYQLSYQGYPRSRIQPGRIDLGTLQLAEPESKLSADEVWLEVYGPKGKSVPKPISCTSLAPIVANIASEPITETLADEVHSARYQIRVENGGGAQDSRDEGESRMRFLVIRFDDGTSVGAAVCWRVEGPLSARPSAIHFGMVAQGDPPKSRKVLVRSTDGRPFRLMSATTGSDAVSIRSPMGPNSMPSTMNIVEIDLSEVGAKGAPVESGTIRLKTDLPGVNEVGVPWSVFRRVGGRSGTNGVQDLPIEEVDR